MIFPRACIVPQSLLSTAVSIDFFWLNQAPLSNQLYVHVPKKTSTNVIAISVELPSRECGPSDDMRQSDLKVKRDFTIISPV